MKKRKEAAVKTLGERLSDMFDMPSDAILDTLKLTAFSDNSIFVENYTGILQYTDSCIKVKTKEKVVSIEGTRLVICVITDGYMQIEGKIDSVRWI